VTGSPCVFGVVQMRRLDPPHPGANALPRSSPG
jgi:hypothetical protein